jgi:hypothetical protein
MTAVRWGAVLSAGGALFGLAIFFILSYEAWALWTGHRPVTDMVRAFGAAHPQWAALAAVVVALLIGHFLWHGSGMVDAELRRMRGER